jgi:signal transduction histidine kinase
MTPSQTIFIVDDDPQILALLEGYLRARYRVVSASSVAGFFERFQGESPDLLLADYHLPDGTGLDIVRKATQERPDLSVIVMTGVAAQDVRVAAESIRLGAIEFLTKPFSLETLEAAIARALALHAEKKRNLRELKVRESLPGHLLSTIEGERQRLAMELHDEIGQTLTTLKMEVEMLSADCAPKDGATSGRLDRIAEKLSRAIDQVRGISYGLRPTNLDALGLEAALGRLLDDLGHNGLTRVTRFFKGMEDRVDRELELAVYRIVQEATTNAIRHAQARNVFVNVIQGDGKISIVVEDDGVGFDPEEVMSQRDGGKRLGLLTMQQRAEQFNGKVWIDSGQGRGTCLTSEIPLR